jgi:hypothetical protein
LSARAPRGCSETFKPSDSVILSRAKDPSGWRASVLFLGSFARLRMTEGRMGLGVGAQACCAHAAPCGILRGEIASFAGLQVGPSLLVPAGCDVRKDRASAVPTEDT